MLKQELLYQIALTLIPGIGDMNGKKLVAHCGSPEAIFRTKKEKLAKIPGIGPKTISAITSSKTLHRAEKEITFIDKFYIQTFFYTEPDYPSRLLHCEDAPLLLYYKGNIALNHPRIVAIVGTRRATNYGKLRCEEMVEGLKDLGVLVVSGLAYGIDSIAHRTAIKADMPTIGVVAHGLDSLYPSQNRKLAESMLDQGGILTEFVSGTKPDRENFPKRNRIVAGMSDAIIVIESDRKGGALITAELGNSYNRDVFAIPGRVDDDMSRGTNFFIKTNRAALAEGPEDIAYIMGWDNQPVQPKAQPELFVALTDDEENMLALIREKGEITIDKLVYESGLPASKVAATLLKLEFEGLVQNLPGKRYKA
jgi:DNA processing protein